MYLERAHPAFLATLVVLVFNLRRDESETEIWQEYADQIFPIFMSKIQTGALIWNFDCQFPSWSMKGLQEVMKVQWNL